ncbi:hypothetical protein, partial [Streptomyces sp. NRRL F-6491]|uniref:hypothetical protein n=1 Tax=Streptomyces sp. NRRL F-6491 TaxID=1519495 RepID=UPI0006C00BD5
MTSEHRPPSSRITDLLPPHPTPPDTPGTTPPTWPGAAMGGGPRRSPLREPAELAELARSVVRRPGFRL